MRPSHLARWPVRFRGTCFLFLGVAVVLGACGGDGESIPVTQTVSPTQTVGATQAVPPGHSIPIARSTPSRVADLFPVVVVIEGDKAWLTVTSVTRARAVEGESEATVILEGSVRALSDGMFEYRLALIDSDGTVYHDSPGILLGALEAGDDVGFQTSIRVPIDAILARLAFWIVGAERPRLSYVIDLPVADIPLRSP